jgi:D-glycero-D-manno-heptose 1,7-bisphosphate phosphatase
MRHLPKAGRADAVVARMKAAVFIERDGILNLCETAKGHQVQPLRLEQFKVNPEAKTLLAELKKAGLLIIGTTVQPAPAKGLMSRNELDHMHAVLRRQLPVDDLFTCISDDPHHPCYKPQPGLFLEAAFKWGIDLDHSFVISDKWQDAKAAQIAGCTSILIRSPWIGNDHHDFVTESFAAAVAKVVQLHAHPVLEPLFASA